MFFYKKLKKKKRQKIKYKIHKKKNRYTNGNRGNIIIESKKQPFIKNYIKKFNK